MAWGYQMNKLPFLHLTHKSLPVLALILGIIAPLSNAQPQAEKPTPPVADSKFEIPASAQQDLPTLESIINTAKSRQEIIGRNYSQITYQKSCEFLDTYELRDAENMTGSSYSYTRKQIFDVSFYRDFPLEILIEDNEKSPGIKFKSKLLITHPGYLIMSEKKRDREREKIDRLYKNAGKQSKPLTPSEGMEKIKWDGGLVILQSLTNSHFSNLRRERFLAREMYVVDFVPAPSNEQKPVFPKEMLAGKLWIDAQSGWVAKAEIVSAFKNNTAQTIFSYSGSDQYLQQPFCDDLWLPRSRETSSSSFRVRFHSYRLNGTEPLCDANNKSKLK